MSTSAREVPATAAGRMLAIWQTTIGKKVVMALTGLIGVGYVVVHMLGNLQVFQGAEKLNAYAAALHGPLKGVVWVVRVVLLLAVVLHVAAAAQLTGRDRAARPVPYARRDPQVSTLASRTMRWGGVLLLVFIVFHVLHFTTGTVQPVPFVAGDVYGNVIGAFRVWWVTLFYALAMVALGFHLFHGAWSAARTLGAAPPSPRPLRRPVAAILALVVAVGFAIVPLAVFFGVVK
ncbi:MAG TPA: succinate dehydrogenase cytochrome b subunit [Gemmatimonadales bacterium]|nr:succinate dehydrogenase cytochrome b subunit [Gemmatimonadales bacterium]